MRQSQIQSFGTVRYPGKWCFAFSRNIVEIDAPGLQSPSTVTVSDTDAPHDFYRFTAVTRNGRAVIEMSEAMQMMFSMPGGQRCKYIHVDIDAPNAKVISFHTYAVWGRLKHGDYFSSFGDFALDNGNACFRRRMIWFKHYPFSVTMFRRLETEPISYCIDDTTSRTLQDTRRNILDIDIKEIAGDATETVTLTHIKDGGTLSLFDNTFDVSFVERYGEMLTESVEIAVSNATEGCYLRWTDRLGNVNYYLFQRGAVSSKSKSSGVEIGTYEAYESKRDIGKTVEETTTLCATSLTSDVLKYVTSVSTATSADEYRNGAWLPVSVSVSSTIDTQKPRNDFEIKITRNLPLQSLI